jgi:hypothetical protein
MWIRKDKDVDTILVATHVDGIIATGSETTKLTPSCARPIGYFCLHDARFGSPHTLLSPPPP